MFSLPTTSTLQSPCHVPASEMEEPAEHKISFAEDNNGNDNDTSNNQVVVCTANTSGASSIHLQLASLDLLNSELLDPECDDALETMESFVGCVEGVDGQHAYEEKMIEHNKHKKAAMEQHALNDVEAAMIRHHIEERDDSAAVHKQQDQQMDDSNIPDMDILNLCGNDDDLDDAQDTFVIQVTQDVISCADIIDEDLLVPRRDTEVRDGIIIGQDINALTCAICFDEALKGGDIALNRVKFANLPCCGGRQQASSDTFIKVCTSCILVLTSPSTTGSHRIGRCPRCLDWIKVQIPAEVDGKNTSVAAVGTGLTVQKILASGPCLICNQEKEHLVENGEVCDSCFLGRRQPLKYECQQCHHHQNIPHPMYRYQETKDSFGNVTWACQGKCGRFAQWRILPEELHRIALGDAPKSWGTDYIKIARRRVAILRADLKDNKGESSSSSSNNNNNNINKGETSNSNPKECSPMDDPSLCRVM